MITEKLDIMKTIREGIQYGLKNFLPLLLMVVLYLLTIWIPYLNVGTTIGLYKAVIGIGRGETIDPVAIFDKDNFKLIGNFFLLQGFIVVGSFAAAVFMFFPAMVIAIAWGCAVFFLIDKKVSPLKALQLSYDSTFGNKWRIFFTGLICAFIIGLVSGILGAIPKIGPVLSVLVALLSAAIMVAVEGVMYNYFSQKADLLIAGNKTKYFDATATPGAQSKTDSFAEPSADSFAEPKVSAQPRDYSAYAPKPDAEPAAETAATAGEPAGDVAGNTPAEPASAETAPADPAPEAPAADEPSPYAPKPDDL